MGRLEHKTYIDGWLKFIRDNVIHEYEERTRTIGANPEIAKYAKEPESVRREHQEAADRRDRMRECLKKRINLEDLLW